VVKKITTLFVIVALPGCQKANTKYAPDFDLKAFNEISHGDRIEVVVNKIGYPLRIEKIDQAKGSTQELEISSKSTLAFDDRGSVYIMSYSLQMNGKRDFERFSIAVKDRVVVASNHEIVTE
jgi:hypothetical protein